MSKVSKSTRASGCSWSTKGWRAPGARPFGEVAGAGSLFYDATAGGQFRPDDPTARLVAAVALVRAAGLQSEVSTASPLAYSDLSEVPIGMRGYVAVAVAHGLLTLNGGAFRPQTPLTRAELAHALAAFSK